MPSAENKDKSPETKSPFPPDGAWFDRALCGMFFHWGPFSVAARGEWVMNRELIGPQEYDRNYIEPWKAEHFDADAWMQAAVDLGAEYVVLVTRHHDGFALWDSEVNPHNSVRLGPKFDVVAAFAEAARRRGLRIGFYYSTANWIHPDYPGAHYRDWPEDDAWESDAQRERFQAYCRAELKELFTRYGSIDYLWYDGGFPENVRDPSWNEMVRELQPGILINNRNGPADVTICEQGIRRETPEGRWEACFTLNRNWGYHSLDDDYKSPLELVEMLIQTATGGGNLLLNIGPRGDGSIPEASLELARSFGQWIRSHRDLLDGAEPSEFGWNNSALVTVADNSVFLHFSRLPEGSFCWAETETPLEAVRIWPQAKPLPFEQNGPRIRIDGLSASMEAGCVTTIELAFRSKPKPRTEQTTFWIPD